MMKWITLALMILASAATWCAAPAWNADAINQENELECRRWTLRRDLHQFLGEPERITAAPETCAAPTQRIDWDTGWLTIAAVLAVGGALSAKAPQEARA
jgi:hypothetical protein